MPRCDNVPDFEFRDGLLRIAAPHCTSWVRGWPTPTAQRKSPHNDWYDFRPDFRLLAPPTPAARDQGHISESCDNVEGGDTAWGARKCAAYDAFRQSIPQDVAALLENFVSHQWNMLHLLHERPAFRDLLQANPVLAWCVANNDQFRKLSARSPAFQARWHINKKQRDLAAWLGFPGTDAFVKLLKRVRLEAVAPFIMRLLQAATQRDDESMKALAHIEHINFGTLYLACHDALRSHIAPNLLIEVSTLPEELTDSPFAAMLTETLAMWAQLRPAEQAPVFHSVKTIAQHHDEFVAARNRPRPPPPPVRKRWKPAMLPPGCFPSPPLAGTLGIIPICTHKELAAESQDQHNCVVNYEIRIYAGQYYVYRVLQPERATLAIKQQNNGYWYDAEIKGPNNRAVKPITLQSVRTWLWRSQYSAPQADSA